MTTATELPANTTNEFAAVNQINAGVQQLQGQLRLQQDLIEQQRAEIDRLQAKIQQLRDQLDQFYRYHGLEARQPTEEEIEEHMKNGISAEEFRAEVERVFGK